MRLPKITPYWQRLAERAACQREDVGRSLKLYDCALRRMDGRVDPARMAAVPHNRSFAQMYAGQGERARDSLARARDLLSDRPDSRGTTELAAVLVGLARWISSLGNSRARLGPCTTSAHTGLKSAGQPQLGWAGLAGGTKKTGGQRKTSDGW